MTELSQQLEAKEEATAMRFDPSFSSLITGYTFVDEQWRSHIVCPPRPFSRRDDGSICPTSAEPVWPTNKPHTMAQRGAEEDQLLGRGCITVEEYEARKQQRTGEASAAQTSRTKSQGTFYPFTRLPIELRDKIWRSAMEEATEVRITLSGYQPPGQCISCLCTARDIPAKYASNAILPALFLVNHESHAIASKHYRRVFRGINGDGGVLAAYPVVLTVETSILSLLNMDDFHLVRDLVLDFRRNPYLACAGYGRLRQILTNYSLKSIECRLIKTDLVTMRPLYLTLHRAYTDIRESQPEWRAPMTRIVLQEAGMEDREAFSHEGGLFRFPALERKPESNLLLGIITPFG
jgi:hypothetical protein